MYKRKYADAFPYVIGSAMSRRKRSRKVSRPAGTVRRGRISSRGVQRSGVTRQRDSRTQYNRRRAPLRLRRRMRRQYNAFRSNLMKFCGTRTVLRNYRSIISAAIGNQIFDSFILYGCGQTGVSGAIERGYNDIRSLMDNDNLLNQSTGDPEFRDSGGSCKFIFDTGILDMTIQNTTNLTTPEGVQGSGVELDIYEFICNGRFDPDLAGGAAGRTLHQFFVNRAADQLVQGSAAQQIDPQDRGVTPFEMGLSLMQSGTKIIRKTKYFVPYGDTVTYQIRDAKNHEVDTRKLTNDQPICCQFAKGVIIVAKVLPQYSELMQPLLVVGSTRKYKYKVFQSHTTRGGINV